MGIYEFVSEICQAKREREAGNIGNNLANERSYKAHDKIIEAIRDDYRDRFLD